MARKKKKQINDMDLMEELDYYEKPKRKINSKFIIGFLLLIIIIAGILFSPLFAVKDIRLEGAEHFTTSELAERISLSHGDNLILFGKGRAEEILEQDPYIAQAQVVADLPSTMVIRVKERKVRGYVPYMGAYLYIDEEGRVLETQNACHEALPIVTGLKFDSFLLGEVLPVENKDSLQVVLQMSQLMKKYDLMNLVVKIDVTDPKDVYAFINKVEIHLGDMKDADQKIRIIGEIMKNIPIEDRGTLDLRDLHKPIIFQYLT